MRKPWSEERRQAFAMTIAALLVFGLIFGVSYAIN